MTENVILGSEGPSLTINRKEAERTVEETAERYGLRVDPRARFEDLPVGTKTAKSMEDGAMFILGNLKAIVEQGRPPLKTRVMYGMFGAMEFVLPKRTKSEHWPLEGRREKEPA